MNARNIRDQADQILADYRPLRGVADEMVDPTGRMRPVWGGLLTHLATRGPAALTTDFGRGAQYLRESGVFFRQYGQDDRDWPLTPLPVILARAEWADIAAGLMQRADLLEQVVADLYGDNRLVAEGLLPADLIAENPEWLRPLVGVQPRSGHFLHFLAFELGRGPDGRWWVIGDRTQAPSGAGFALENRIACSRSFAELYRSSHVMRLAGFFGAFRAALDGLGAAGAQPAMRRAGILTAGPMTDTYHEQAYIARYLGLPLLEGADFLVQDGLLHVRTVDGLSPVDVLWRRMDAGWCDPLELDETSRIGIPGLMAAVRQGSVTMVNALGAGVAEMQALMAFLPTIAEHLTGAPLRLPNIATWWCGGAEQAAHVRANAHRMLIGPALATRLPLELQGRPQIEGPWQAGSRLDDMLAHQPRSLVGQELVTLSTTPVWEAGHLVAHPMTLRMFLARGPKGWQVMPGGFARIGKGQDAGAIAMQNGSAVADVWVLSDQPVARETLLTASDRGFARAEPGALPSRAADNLFWLGRYIERTESLARLARAYHARLEEAGTDTAPLLRSLRTQMAQFGEDAAEPLSQGLRSTLTAAVRAAGQIRDRFSVDGWAALMDLDKTTRRMADTVVAGADASLAMGVLLRKINGFSGLVHENMYRAAGWRFLTMGRALERGATMANLLATLAEPGAPQGALDLLIEIGDSVMTHRQRYAVATGRESVVDLLALDGNNPRSIRFQLAEIRAQSDALAGGPQSGQITDFGRRVLAVETSVAIQTPLSLDGKALAQVHDDILSLSPALSRAYQL